MSAFVPNRELMYFAVLKRILLQNRGIVLVSHLHLWKRGCGRCSVLQAKVIYRLSEILEIPGWRGPRLSKKPTVSGLLLSIHLKTAPISTHYIFTANGAHAFRGRRLPTGNAVQGSSIK